MSVLSIRNRVEYAVIGAIVCVLTSWAAYRLAMTGSAGDGLGAYIVGILGLGFLRQMLIAPPNISLHTWWYRNCRKFEISCVSGTYYYSSLCDLRTWALYDLEGYLVGWQGENCEGYPFFKPASEVHGDKRYHSMKFISRLRSPKLPKPQAEVLAADGDVVGYTEYKML